MDASFDWLGWISFTLAGGVGVVQFMSYLRNHRERLRLVGVDVEPKQRKDGEPYWDMWYAVANMSGFPVYIREGSVQVGSQEPAEWFPWRQKDEERIDPHSSLFREVDVPRDGADTPITIRVELQSGTRFKATITRAKQEHGPIKMSRDRP